MATLREERRETAKAYRRIAKELMALHSSGANVISRYDNNHVFELSWKLKDIASRITKGYPDTSYARRTGEL